MGFFLVGDTPKQRRIKQLSDALVQEHKAGRKARLPAITIPLVEDRTGKCEACTLLETQNEAPQMEPTGSSKPWLYVLGEYPSAQDDASGEQFSGWEGKILRDALPIALAKHVRWNNSVRCHPPENRTPSALELRQCARLQIADIETTKPPIVLALGAAALEMLTGETKIMAWRGLWLRTQIGTHACWVVPEYSLSYFGYKRKDSKEGRAVEDLFMNSLSTVFEVAIKARGGPTIAREIVTAKEMDQGLDWVKKWDVAEVDAALTRLRQSPVNAIDYETTGIRPYARDANIVSVAFGTWDYSFAIPLHHAESKWTPKQLKQVEDLIKAHLRSIKVRFVAHNLAFEQEWTAVKLDPRLLHRVKWEDTMAQAWTLNNTQPMSLDARTRIYLGINTKRLDTLDKSRMYHEPLEQVLRYNARDVKATHRIHQLQEDEIRHKDLVAAYREYIDRHPAVVLAQVAGMEVDTDFADGKHAEYTEKMQGILAKINAQKVVKTLEAKTGKPFNLNSNPQLVVLFRDLLREKAGWRKSKGEKKYSTDEEALSKSAHPIAKLIIDYRKVQKLDSTYIKGFMNKRTDDPDCGKHIHDDGLVHTQYNILIARTGRLSSEDPNLQNIPIRTEEGRRIRNAFVVPDDCQLVSLDMGQIEARVIGMASKDENLCRALWTSFDIHGEWTDRFIAEFGSKWTRQFIEEGEDNSVATIRKRARNQVKNTWTFPLFFGSEVGAVASDMLIDESALAPFVDAFWDQYPGVREWQQRMIRLYQERGYCETLTGRRRYGPLSNEAAINSPIQGTATDLILNSANRLSRYAHEHHAPQIQPRMQIHDDLTFVLPNESMEQDLEIIVPAICTPDYDFVNVPITVECKIGKRWGEQVEVFKAESTEYGFPNGGINPFSPQVPSRETRGRVRPQLRDSKSAKKSTRPRLPIHRPIGNR